MQKNLLKTKQYNLKIIEERYYFLQKKNYAN